MKRKKITVVSLIAMMVLIITACQSEPTGDLNSLTVGQDNVQFGPYIWQVLDVQDDKALLITKDIIEKAVYHGTYESITWEDCSLREYLNGDFFENSFSEEEKAKIIEVTNPNPDNQWFDTKGGNDTQDKVSLLSVEEAVKYFGDSGQLTGGQQEHHYNVDDKFNRDRIAQYDDENIWWWLRSPGNSSKFAAVVTHKGIIEVGGYFVQTEFGIRPVIWVKTA